MMKQFLHTYCNPVHSSFCPGLRQNLCIQILSVLKFLFLFSNEMVNIILLGTWDNLTPLLWEMFDNMWLLETEHGFRKVLAAVDKLLCTLFQFILIIAMPSIPHVGPTILTMYWQLEEMLPPHFGECLQRLMVSTTVLHLIFIIIIIFFFYSTVLEKPDNKCLLLKPFPSPHCFSSHY